MRVQVRVLFLLPPARLAALLNPGMTNRKIVTPPPDPPFSVVP